MNKKILLLGGTGAMGIYLIPELLEMGYEVFVTTRKEKSTNKKNLHYIKGNAKEEKFLIGLLCKNKFDAIVDFMVYKTDEFKSRVRFLLKNTKHYVFLSTYRVYSNNDLVPIVETTSRLLDVVNDTEYLKTEEYALTKARQEDILKKSNLTNWTILRPAITYSKERFQLGTMEAHEFLYRALKGKKIIFPKEMLDKETTMSWAGDVGRMMAKIVLNNKTYGEIYTISTGEHHKWKEIVKYYKKIIGMRVKIIPLASYKKLIGREYQINYDRMYNRIINNNKILKITNMKQSDLMKLEDGLKIELTAFSKMKKTNLQNIELDKKIEKVVESKLKKLLKRIKPRTRLKQIKGIIKGKFLYDGAIVSLSGYHNYGGLMQRYALQQFLKQNGYKFKLLNFKFMLKMGKKVGNRKNTILFSKKYLDEEYFNARASKYYKTYIVGSDQVWRDWYRNWKKFGIFFLNFTNNRKTKRIAYSVSFGVDSLEIAGINENNIEKIKKLVSKFDCISVREKTAKEMVKLLSKDSSVTLDPTLLLSATHYSKIIESSSSKDIKTSEIFYYLLDPNQNKHNIVKEFEERLEMKAEGILPNNGLCLMPVENWLKGFRDSKLIITDSYHGMIFSIINKKPFIVFGNKGRGLSRMKDLLKLLRLEDRMIMDNEKVDESLFDLKIINWKKIEKILEKNRQESSYWLLNNLKK
ncbi:MAG: polysaccharide pyruvyl transferase family protein [Bacilli bacterium]|nr:polysaccharide pyruvyl transferase family protein [Bacilli bacterium]